MKKIRKTGYFLYCLAFLSACAVPGAMLAMHSDDSTAENRKLAEFPALLTEEGEFNQAWSKEFQAYVSDHFGFRKQLVRADSRLKASLLHASSEEDVIVGSDGWLYYTPTANDFLGNPTVSPLGIQNIVHNLEMMQDYAESKSSTFVAAVVPNKNTVYPEHMPYNYRNSGIPDNLDNLSKAISESNVNWCQLSEELTAEAARSEALLYHKTDTHWNNTGALVGYRVMMEATGMPYADFSDASFTMEAVWNGDLQKMLFPDTEALDDQNVYDIDFTFGYQGRYVDSDDITINTLNPAGTGSLLMFRDSFGAAIIPYFSQQFMTARYSRSRPNPMYNLDAQHYDAVILEIVERNIAWLQKEAPMHEAPFAEAVPQATSDGVATLYTDQNGASLFQLYGTVELPQDLTEAPTYYVTVTDRFGVSHSYLAYNCFEADKLGAEMIQDNGYSLYIPTDLLFSGESYAVTLTVEAGSLCMTCNAGSFTYETP